MNARRIALAVAEPESIERAPASSDDARSALADALATVGDRWTLLIVATLLDGPRRFGELQDEVEGIAPNVLTRRLRAPAQLWRFGSTGNGRSAMSAVST